MSIITPPSPSIAASPMSTQIEPDDLLSMDGLFELADGRLIEKHMSFEAGDTAVMVISVLHAFVSKHGLGKVVSEVSFRCFPEKPKQVRRPDIAFISTARLPSVPKEGHVPIRPDLAIEIVSPGDEVYDLDQKLRDYKSAGIPLSWVFNPEQRLVRVYEAGRFKVELEEDEELRGEPVLPGFMVRVNELFPAVDSAAA